VCCTQEGLAKKILVPIAEGVSAVGEEEEDSNLPHQHLIKKTMQRLRKSVVCRGVVVVTGDNKGSIKEDDDRDEQGSAQGEDQSICGEVETAMDASYIKFVDHFMPAIKGEKRWGLMRQECCLGEGSRKFCFSDHATISDEAFLIVCIENYSSVWDHDIAEQSVHEDGEDRDVFVGAKVRSDLFLIVLLLEDKRMMN